MVVWNIKRNIRTMSARFLICWERIYIYILSRVFKCHSLSRATLQNCPDSAQNLEIYTFNLKKIWILTTFTDFFLLHVLNIICDFLCIFISIAQNLQIKVLFMQEKLHLVCLVFRYVPCFILPSMSDQVSQV